MLLARATAGGAAVWRWLLIAAKPRFRVGEGSADSYTVITQTLEPDWKVTTGYRVLLGLGWAVTALAVSLALAASILDSVRVWWMVVGLAAAGNLTGLLLPEPVPRRLLRGPRTMADLSKSSPR